MGVISNSPCDRIEKEKWPFLIKIIISNYSELISLNEIQKINDSLPSVSFYKTIGNKAKP